MRDSVKSLFPERDCFALVRPCLEEEQLANMDGLTMQQLRPEFRKVRAALTRDGGGMPSNPCLLLSVPSCYPLLRCWTLAA